MGVASRLRGKGKLAAGVIGGAAAGNGAADGAAVDDDEPPAGVRLGADRLHQPAAGVGAVAGVDVHVERPEAERAMVARGVAERGDLAAAMRADETAVVFGKPFLFHADTSKTKFAGRIGENRDFLSENRAGSAQKAARFSPLYQKEGRMSTARTE